MASGLIVLADVVPDEQPVSKTRPHHGEFLCLTCDAEFMRYRDYERHTIDCAERWEAELMAESMKTIHPAFYAETDVEPWFRKNRQAILEGRLKP